MAGMVWRAQGKRQKSVFEQKYNSKVFNKKDNKLIINAYGFVDLAGKDDHVCEDSG